jgi:hypothetical protein
MRTSWENFQHFQIEVFQQFSSLLCRVRAGIVMEDNHTTAKKTGVISAPIEERKSSDFQALPVSIAGYNLNCRSCAPSAHVP